MPKAKLTTMTTDEMRAHTQGRTAGEDTDSHAGDCPYPHSTIDLRLAWMDGFSKGRHSIEQQAAGQTHSAEPSSEET